MKNRGVLVSLTGLFIFIILTNLTLAISDDSKSAYSPGETIITKISGNILDNINPNQVEFYRGHVLISREYDLKNIGGNYYLWFIAPLDQNNYSFVIKDIFTTLNGQTTKINYEKNFSIIGNLTDYSVNPGFISTNKDFEINVRSNQDQDQVIDIAFLGKSQYTLKPGDNLIKFPIDNFFGDNLTIINVGKYSIPAYIIGKPLKDYVPIIVLNPRRIENNILITDNIIFPVTIINVGEKEAKNLVFQYNKSIFSLNNDNYPNFLPGESLSFNLTINKDFIGDKEDLIIRENISAFYDNYSVSMPVYLNLTRNQTKVTQNTSYNANDLLLCLEINGQKCASDAKCSIAEINTKEGLCCKGECIVQKSSSNKVWIGFAILVFVVIIIIIVLLKYKKVGKPKNPIQKELYKIQK